MMTEGISRLWGGKGLDAPIPYVIASDTSKAAAEAKRPTALSDEALVLSYIETKGSEGSTDCETEHALGLLHQNASARRNSLVRKGLVCDSGTTRPTTSGRQATVWISGKGTPIEGAPNARHPRPSNLEMAVAVENIRELIEHARKTNGPAIVSDETLTVIAWLNWIRRDAADSRKGS